jgi:hypothetical protein
MVSMIMYQCNNHILHIYHRPSFIICFLDLFHFREEKLDHPLKNPLGEWT